MYKIIDELESLGDSGEAISRILTRKNNHRKYFDTDIVKNLVKMVDQVDNGYVAMIDNLNAAHTGTLYDVANAYNVEHSINNMRNYLREAEIEDIESGKKNYQSSIYYMDVVNELERMGDFMINISQDLERTFMRR